MAKYIKTEEGYKTIDELGIATNERADAPPIPIMMFIIRGSVFKSLSELTKDDIIIAEMSAPFDRLLESVGQNYFPLVTLSGHYLDFNNIPYTFKAIASDFHRSDEVSKTIIDIRFYIITKERVRYVIFIQVSKSGVESISTSTWD